MLVHNSEFKRISNDGVDIKLTKLEYMVLSLLVDNMGQTVTRDRMFGHVYAGREWPEPKILDVVICGLRKKISGIMTVWGLGYRIDNEIP